MTGPSTSVAPPVILDTEDTFRRCINAYTLLERAASAFLADIHRLPPHLLEQQARQLAILQEELREGDEQIFLILSLAGLELRSHPMLANYLHIQSTVIELLGQIQNELLLIKNQLVNSSTTHRILDTSL